MAEWETIDVIGARGSRAGVGLADPWFLNSALRDSLAGRTFDAIPTPNVPQVIDVIPETLESVEVRAQRAWAAASSAQRAALLSGLNQQIDFVATQIERDLSRYGREFFNAPIFEERYGREILNDALDRAAARAAALQPEVAVVAARFAVPEVLMGAARILGGVPFGIATGILQGTYEAGRVLSDAALRNAIERLALPGIGGSGTPVEVPEPASEPLPDVILPDVTVSQPRPRAPTFPVLVPTMASPFGDPFSAPFFDTPSGSPTPSRPTVAPPNPLLDPISLSGPIDFPISDPLTFAFPPGFPQPGSSAPPILTGANPPGVDSGRPDRCPPCAKDKQKKRKEKKKQRERCFRGSYVETKSSLFKSPKEEIPCQSSSVNSVSQRARRLARSTVRRTSSLARGRSQASGSLLLQLGASLL